MKKTIIALIIIVIIGLGIYAITKSVSNNNEGASLDTTTATTTALNTKASSTPSTSTPAQNNGPEEVIGKSVENRNIVAYHFGTGTKELLFIGGIHGGYEWNTALVGYELVEYLQQNPKIIPANVKVTVIPVLNPDGLHKVVATSGTFSGADVNASTSLQVAGRFNANNVDINRNFGCDWKATGTWQNKTVSGGTKAFSEPESIAIKNYVAAHTPTTVVAWFSAAGGVYASHCGNSGVSADSLTLTNLYATASGYPAHKTFDSYETSGDITNWFAENNIPAISVLLTNHTDTEWTKNKAGIDAILKYFAQ